MNDLAQTRVRGRDGESGSVSVSCVGWNTGIPSVGCTSRHPSIHTYTHTKHTKGQVADTPALYLPNDQQPKP